MPRRNPHIHPDPGRNLVRAEAIVRRASIDAMVKFIQLIRRNMGLGDSLTAANAVPEMARLLQWWGTSVDAHLAGAIEAAWLEGYRATTDLSVVARSQDAVGQYVAHATDRLSRTATPLVPDQAWNQLQTAIAQEMSIGSSNQQLSRRIAAELRWDVDTVFWEQRKAQIASRLDDILDPLGPPGSPAREAARLHDPVVRELQSMNGLTTRRLDAERSVWETRANRIARTESTGAYNGGTFDAGIRSGAVNKRWVASFDDRTRDTHMRANGQTVGVGDEFSIGMSRLQFPGDPGGAGEETINCRCTMTFPDTVDESMIEPDPDFID